MGMAGERFIARSKTKIHSLKFFIIRSNLLDSAYPNHPFPSTLKAPDPARHFPLIICRAYHNLTWYIFSVQFLNCLYPHCNTSSVTGGISSLLYSWLYPQLIERCLTHSTCQLVTVQWVASLLPCGTGWCNISNPSSHKGIYRSLVPFHCIWNAPV